MDAKFFRKYLMSKLDAAQREVEILKAAIEGLDSDGPAPASEEVEDAPPVKKSSKKDETKKTESKKKTEEVVEESTDMDDFMSDEPLEDDVMKEPTSDDVRKIIKDFATKHGKEKSLKLLSKFGASAINDIKKKDFSKVIELASKHL